MKINKLLFGVSIIANLLTVAFIAKKYYIKQQISKDINTIKKSKNIHYEIRNDLFKQLPLNNNSIVFIGTSLTQNFELTEFLQNENLKNRGINGDVVKGAIDRLPNIIKYKPKKIFVEIGINDLGNNNSVKDILKDYKKLIDIIQTESPDTKLYIQSIFPTALSGTEMPQAYYGEKTSKDIKLINRELLAYSKIKKITFIDTYSHFTNNDYIDPNLTFDGVHLTGKGYKLWSDILKRFI